MAESTDFPLLVDCRGMVCPMPIVQVRLALNQSTKDDLLVVYADDATFESEFARFCYLADIKLIEKRNLNDFQEYTIQVLK
jgi:TusA-related sulfurtransferase